MWVRFIYFSCYLAHMFHVLPLSLTSLLSFQVCFEKRTVQLYHIISLIHFIYQFTTLTNMWVQVICRNALLIRRSPRTHLNFSQTKSFCVFSSQPWLSSNHLASWELLFLMLIMIKKLESPFCLLENILKNLWKLSFLFFSSCSDILFLPVSQNSHWVFFLCFFDSFKPHSSLINTLISSHLPCHNSR